MKSNEKCEKNFNQFSKMKNYDNVSTIDDSEDCDSFFDDDSKSNHKLKISKLKMVNKNVEVFSIKQLPTLFFFIFIIVLSILLTNFVPHIHNLSRTSNLYKSKFNIKYLPQFLSEQSLPIKV